jgi:hypothetical protein
MRQALARLDVGAVVAILRRVTGLSQVDLANLVEGWSQSTVSLIENRRRDTLYDIRELLRFADAVDMPREALLPLVFGDVSATLEKDDDLGLAGALDVNRRSFNTLTASLAAGAVLPPIRVPSRVDEAHVRYLGASLERLRRREQSHGGGAIVREAVRLFSQARALLDESDYSERIGRQLLAVAAEIGNAAGWAAYDQADQALARQLYGEACVLVDGSGATEVAVHLYTNRAQQSTELALGTGRHGLAREALRFADRAAAAARHEPSPKLHALIALRQARAHAVLGDKHGFRGAIITARRELDRGPHPADPQWSSYVTDSQISYSEAFGSDALAHARGESAGRAAALYRASLDDGLAPRDEAGTRAQLARTLLTEGDRAQAISEGLAVLPDLGQRMISTRTLNRLRPVRAAAEKAAAEEFCVRFDAAARALTAA